MASLILSSALQLKQLLYILPNATGTPASPLKSTLRLWSWKDVTSAGEEVQEGTIQSLSSHRRNY